VNYTGIRGFIEEKCKVKKSRKTPFHTGFFRYTDCSNHPDKIGQSRKLQKWKDKSEN
jgi:hypothetical protein